MDFSSVPRSLESLRRRQPPLDERVVALSRELAEEGDQCRFLELLEELLTFHDCPAPTAAAGEKKKAPRWEPLAVGLYVATEVLQRNVAEIAAKKTTYMEGPRLPETTETDADKPLRIDVLDKENALQLCRILHGLALEHMEHDEPRVRTLVAKNVGSYCRVSASLGGEPQLREEIFKRLADSIHEHLERGRVEEEEKGGHSRDSTGALDDTTGWRALETNWQCLAALVSALGEDYWTESPLEGEQKQQMLLEDCQQSAVEHVNRHVRAAAMAVLEQWVVAAAASPDHSSLVTATTSPLRKATVAVLRTGLADNWSQVRMAASVLCRVFLTTLQRIAGDDSVNDIYPAILPRMCLNRFYLAQGVKLYSHETWKMVVKDRGVHLVAQHLPAVCRYYVKMCDADNHVVREAACQAIAELAVRLGENSDYHDKLMDSIGLLLQALLMCFHDESWPVRDEACLACGILCKSYPEECRPELKTLWERWTEQLTDQIWSVRQDAAVALGDALQAYGPEFLQRLRGLVDKLLPSARDQPAMTQEEYKAHVNDFEKHQNSQLYSCGSLAPKLRKGGAGRIGCTNCGIDRPKAPWEATDGCIYLIRELCIVCAAEGSPTPLTDNDLLPLMQELADVCRVQHFPQGDDLRQTLWRQLPAMAQALGKQRFKRLYLEIFMDLLLRNMESRTASQLSIHAAGQCAEELAEFIGPSIFRARLDDFQRETFDKVMRERSMMPKGPPNDEGYSPYGPAGLLNALASSGGFATTTAPGGY